MKKIYFSLMTIAALLFTACNSDEGPGNGDVKGGVLETTITFEGITKDATSTAIPTVSWANVKQVQLFLYDKETGEVKFSDIITPSSSLTQFIWQNVPEGEYRMLLLANVNSDTDDIDTWFSGTKQKFTNWGVVGNSFGTTFATSDIQIDLKSGVTLPTSYNWGSLTGYKSPSEIFTAYADDVEIEEGETTQIHSGLVLRREISLLRVRIDKTTNAVPEKVSQLGLADFNHASNFMAIRRLPVGFGVNVSPPSPGVEFAGGVFDFSDDNRVLLASTGTSTYETQNPSTGYEPKIVLPGGTDPFSLWKDIRVLPNVSEAQKDAAVADGDKAPSNRRYYIIFSAWVPTGYKDKNEQVASEPKLVYWYGTINGAFYKNTIREVNITINSPGSFVIPDPIPEGELDIIIGAPEPWNSTIQETSLEV